MLNLLSKLFIKDYKNYSDSKVRTQYGVLCGVYGIFWNVLLFGAKFIVGTIAASVAMVADAFNNLSDAASSVVNILGFKLASKKPDPEHPFGHGRMEYISGLVISGLIFLMALELFKSSLKGLINGFTEPTQQEFSVFSLIVLILAILVKLYMYFYNHSIGKKIDSVSLEATAKDSLSDTISTLVVIISLVLGRFTTFPVDGIAGLIVSVFIFMAGYEAAKEKLSLVVEWLNDNKDENGQWDFGPKANDGVYFPLSDSWRKAEDRKRDCTERVNRFLNRMLA